MMGPQFWKPQVSTRLKKCSEFVAPACDLTATDGCCAVIPCEYCLEWSVYGEPDVFSIATFAGDGWYGTIAGAAFRGYWERNYYSGECEFVVTLDDVEIYRASCDDGQSCRDSSAEAEATIGYDEGTLKWEKVELRPLPYVTDTDTNCRTHFCGACECSCECLCVEITDGYTSTVIERGEICDTAYDCDGPLWQGTVGEYELSLALGRDSYGECVIAATVDGVAQDDVAADGCSDMSATITLSNGTIIAVVCKVCDCAEVAVCPCCPEWSQLYSGIIYWSSTPATNTDCEGGLEEIAGDFGCDGDASDTEIRPASPYDFFVRLTCDPETKQWKLQYRSPTSGGLPYNTSGASDVWADATDVTVECPDCAEAVDGVAYGSISGTGHAACETSGGDIEFDVAISGIIEIVC